jgi:hypothetical protein
MVEFFKKNTLITAEHTGTRARQTLRIAKTGNNNLVCMHANPLGHHMKDLEVRKKASTEPSGALSKVQKKFTRIGLCEYITS